LLNNVGGAEGVAAARRLATVLAADPASRPEKRLQALVNLYNVADAAEARFDVLRSLLTFARVAGLADTLLPVVRLKADSWATELRLGVAGERELLVACADALRSCTRKPKTATREAYRLLTRCLATYQSAPPAELAGAAPVAAQVAQEFIRSPDAFQFDLIDSAAVRHLAGHPQHGGLHRLLTIYVTGGVRDFREFVASAEGAAVLSSVGVTAESALAKMRLLALVGLAHGRQEVAFSEVAASLEVPESEVESMIVLAISQRLLEARIDQLRGAVDVGKCPPRTFGHQQWEELRGQLRGWREATFKARSAEERREAAGGGAAALPALLSELEMKA
jgi:translation initiation factor 3 subunit M